MSRAAQRIISLLPGATEWVCALGLEQALVAVSDQCDYPEAVRGLPRVTRARIDSSRSSREIDAVVRSHSEQKQPLYELDSQAVLRLKPDLILTQSLCNVCAVSQRDVLRSVASLDVPCRVLDLRAETFDEVLDEAAEIAQAAGESEVSRGAIASLQGRVDRVRAEASGASQPRPRVTLLEWVDPMFCAGHWTPQLIEWAGGDDPIGRSGQPSRVISMDELTSADPDILLVACCGLDAARTQNELANLAATTGWSDLQAVRSGQVHIFDGSAYFNRPGPRLVDALERVAGVVGQWSAIQLA